MFVRWSLCGLLRVWRKADPLLLCLLFLLRFCLLVLLPCLLVLLCLLRLLGDLLWFLLFFLRRCFSCLLPRRLPVAGLAAEDLGVLLLRPVQPEGHRRRQDAVLLHHLLVVVDVNGPFGPVAVVSLLEVLHDIDQPLVQAAADGRAAGMALDGTGLELGAVPV